MIITKVKVINKIINKPVLIINDEEFEPNAILILINNLLRSDMHNMCTYDNMNEFKFFKFLSDNNIINRISSITINNNVTGPLKEYFYLNDSKRLDLIELKEFIKLRIDTDSNTINYYDNRATEIKRLCENYNLNFSTDLIRDILKWAREDAELLLKITFDDLVSDLYKNNDVFELSNEQVGSLSNYANELYLKLLSSVRTQYDKPDEPN